MPSPSGSSSSPQTARVRLLQTTDLHMQLLPFDYGTLAPALGSGLAHLCETIAGLRSAGPPTILVDTGDFLQGNALADRAMTAPAPHPMIAALNELAYDAVVLGNHDFDYGLGPLRQALSDLACPVLAANLSVSDDDPIAEPSTIIDVQDGAVMLRVGLLGLTVAPPLTVCNPAQPPFVTSTAALDAAAMGASDLRARGADVVVALCHFGIDPADDHENVADKVAQVAGIDAVFAGHTHDEFPGPDFPADTGIDAVTGRLHGTPAVMAGVYGRAVGKIDLTLQQGAQAWQVASADCAVIHPPASPAPAPLPVPGLLRLHEETLQDLRATVTQTHVPLSTAFSMIAPDLGQCLLARARIAAVRTLLAGTSHSALPIVGTAAPYQAGTKDSPGLYLDIEPGVLTKHDTQGIFPFQDPVIGLLQTAQEIRDWIEISAGRFETIVPGLDHQPLIDPAFAPYDFKTVFGLTCVIDPSRPVGNRVSDLRYEGAGVSPDQRFVVATTPRHLQSKDLSYAEEVLCITTRTSQQILEDHLRAHGPVTHHVPAAWRLAPLRATKAQFVSAARPNMSQAPRGVIPQAPRLDGLQNYTYDFDPS